MHKRMIASALLLAGLVSGCGQPTIDYETATTEQQEEWLDAASRGVYDGLKRTLPKGRNGVYMKMGERKIDARRRRIDILVNVKFSGEPQIGSDVNAATMYKGACPTYIGTPLEANKVKIYTRFAMEGGGTLLAFMLSPENCTPYATA
ncbi:MAG: hypothetical protein P8J20_01825 [Novosphingobium sp.]|nr:hypothetical protein [Novosphingobium sp.]